jgi:hypothetical protein
VFTALKSVFDPVVREGFGANLPGVSLLKDPKIDLTTGRPLEVTQRIPNTDVSLPSVSGVPVPGMYRELTPVAKMLSKYGEMTYRANRLPIGGVPANDAPKELTQAWQMEFGRLREQMQTKLIPSIARIEAKVSPDQLQPGKPVYEAIRAKIKTYDAAAARAASQKINSGLKTPMKLPRELTAREKRMPTER